MHPVIVHFGFALIVTALIAYLLSASLRATPRAQSLVSAGDWMLAFGSIAILATAASGLWAYYTVPHDGPSHEAMTLHRNWALPTGAFILLMSAWRWKHRAGLPDRGFIATFTLACASLTVTAWLGGKVVYEHGIGVQRLPVVTGDAHDHDHGDDKGHAHRSEGHSGDDRVGAPATPELLQHDALDGHHDVDPSPSPDPDISHSHDDHPHDHPNDPHRERR